MRADDVTENIEGSRTKAWYLRIRADASLLLSLTISICQALPCKLDPLPPRAPAAALPAGAIGLAAVSIRGILLGERGRLRLSLLLLHRGRGSLITILVAPKLAC
jgi:hypothetical protein